MQSQNGLHRIRRAICASNNLIRVRFLRTTARPPRPQILRHGTSYYWETQPPTAARLDDADRFFNRTPPSLIDSATKFRTVKATAMPEVAFLGRSNVGKSSLLNALMGKELCHTSKHPGRTRSMNFFAIGGQDPNGNPGSLAVLDMPGYGKASREEWGKEIVKYLIGRKQLRRAFVLVDAMHGLKATDEQMLDLLRENGVPHQVLLSKVDRLLCPDKKFSMERAARNFGVLDEVVGQLRTQIQPGLGDGPDALGEVIACSSMAQVDGQKLGIPELRWTILTAIGFANRAT